MIRLALLFACASPLLAAPDRDKDGLPDLAETHKYGTDPARADTDGDGTPDGDWHERREYAYTIRSVIRVMPPYNKAALNDDYQDARILAENDRFIELEVVHYPLNTWRAAIRGRAGWRAAARTMKDALAPGVTTNWDAAMQRTLAEELAARGIDAAALTDEQYVRRTAAWLLERARYRSMFCTYYVDFPRGAPRIHPGLEARFHREKGDPSWTVEQQLAHGILGRGMFANKSHGSCTSAAIYLTTGLRAAGVPTRMVLAVPFIDGSDPAQRELVKSIRHHGVRDVLTSAAARLKTAFSAHTYNEVFVGGRWVRLNYGNLGQNIHDARLFGLVTHVHRFHDLSEANLAATWGKRYAMGERSEDFRFSNPYRTLELSDRFGVHARIENKAPTYAATLKTAFWYGERQEYKSAWMGRDGKGYLLVELEDGNDNKHVIEDGDPAFVLKAPGHPDIPATNSKNYWRGGKVIALVIDARSYARMPKGVPFRLHARNKRERIRWTVPPTVTVTK